MWRGTGRRSLAARADSYWLMADGWRLSPDPVRGRCSLDTPHPHLTYLIASRDQHHRSPSPSPSPLSSAQATLGHIQHPASGIQHPTISTPTSSIQHPAFNIQQPTHPSTNNNQQLRPSHIHTYITHTTMPERSLSPPLLLSPTPCLPRLPPRLPSPSSPSPLPPSKRQNSKTSKTSATAPGPGRRTQVRALQH